MDVTEREAAYKKINQQIAEEYLPGLPISHSPPALVVSGNVEGLVPSPLTAEMFDTVTVRPASDGRGHGPTSIAAQCAVAASNR